MQSSAFFFFNDTATTEIYTLSLHDALPISADNGQHETPTHDRHHSPGSSCDVNTSDARIVRRSEIVRRLLLINKSMKRVRSEEHTSELQSQSNLVCRLLLEKKKYKDATIQP